MSRVTSKKYKIIFIGTSEFGAIILEKLSHALFKPILVITASDKPKGRKQILTPSPVKIIAEKHSILIEQPDKIENCKLKIKNLKPHLGIVAAYGQILPKDILDIPKFGFLNIHPSLLPKYRGPSPIQTVILNGEKTTGVSVILMDEEMDHGPILAQRESEILNPKSEIRNKFQITNSKITYRELLEKLADSGTKLLVEIIPKWMEGKIKPKIQDESKATYTKILRRQDGKIDWQKSAEDLERQIRAFDPWPKSYTYIKSKILKILKAGVLSPDSGKQKGEVLLTKNKQLAVQTGKGLLVLEEVQLEGKTPMKARDFLNGYPQIIGTRLI